LVGSSAREASAQTNLLTVAVQPQKAARPAKADIPKASKTVSDKRAARLNSSAASARLRIKTARNGGQESWTVATTTRPATKGSKQISFRVRVSDVGFRVCLVYYDEIGKRREPYLCYLSAKEWGHARRGTLASFAQLVTDKLAERAAKWSLS
jgi:hypothetical protein